MFSINSVKTLPGHRMLFAFFIIIVSGVFVYRKALDNFFYGDDFGFMNDARSIHLFEADKLWPGIISIIQPFWFRVEFVYFFINNLLESLFGTNAFLYHLHNIALHIVSSFLVFGIAQKLTKSFKISLIGCFLFLSNPLPAETVYWNTGAHTLYVALFVLFTLWNYSRANYKASLLFFALAMCTKPEASVLFPYIIMLDIVLFGFGRGREFRRRTTPFFLSACVLFGIYALYYRNAASWPIPEHRFLFHLQANSPEQIFRNFSYLVFPHQKLYYLAIPIVFSLFYLNLKSREKRLLFFSCVFLFLSILPYQLFIIDPNGFYFFKFKTIRYFYIPSIGQAFLGMSALGIVLSRVKRWGRFCIYTALGGFIFLNVSSVGRLDKLFEDREYYYQTLVKGVEPYFNKDKNKFFVLFDFPSFADPVLKSFYTSDFPLMSGIFFDYRLFSASELSSPPDSSWIKEQYAILPPRDAVIILKFDGRRIIPVPPQEQDIYYRNFISQAAYLYKG